MAKPYRTIPVYVTEDFAVALNNRIEQERRYREQYGLPATNRDFSNASFIRDCCMRDMALDPRENARRSLSRAKVMLKRKGGYQDAVELIQSVLDYIE